MTNWLTISLNKVLLITVLLIISAVSVMAQSNDSGVIFVVTNPDGRPDFKGAPLHTAAVDAQLHTILIARGQRVRVEAMADDGTCLVTVIDLPENIGRGTIDGKYLTTIGGEATFNDVPDDHWAASSIASLAEDGIIQGYDNNFMGQKSFTRYEMSMILAPLVKEFREMQDTRQSQLTIQNDRLQALEEKMALLQTGSSKDTGSSKEDDTILREDLRALENALSDLQETVTGLEHSEQNFPAADTKLTKQVAENTKQVAENTKQVAESTKQVAESTKQVAENTKQVAENTKVISRLMVKSSVNDARLDELDKLETKYRQLIGKLNTNSKALANISTKSSVTTDFSDLVKRLNTNSEVLANVMSKSSANTAIIKVLLMK